MVIGHAVDVGRARQRDRQRGGKIARREQAIEVVEIGAGDRRGLARRSGANHGPG